MRMIRPSSLAVMKRRQRQRQRRNRPRYVRTGLQIVLVLAVCLGTVVLAGSGLAAAAGLRMYTLYADELPDITALTVWDEEFQTVRIYDRTGEHLLLSSLDPRPFTGDRTYVPLDSMSPWIWKSALALEDRSFWTNPGISLRGISRAFLSNLAGGEVQGGSSITQQLIKNIAISHELRAQRSYARKIREMMLSLELTRRYEKEQILEWYLNFNFYGNLAYGIEAASRVYFGKSSTDLSLAEAAMLAPIPQYQAMNPFYLPERAKARQRLALDAMVEAGYIQPAEADAAFAEELVYTSADAELFDIRLAPHFSLYVLDQLKQEFNTIEDPFFIWKHGLTVRTTLDLELQQYAAETADRYVGLLDRAGKNASNASVVAIEPATGEVKVMLGSIDYEDRTIDGQVNVSLADRQPGSSFKPYVYIAGLEKGMTAADMLLDVRTAFTLDDGSIYVPENFDRSYHGPVSMRTALARSYNIPSIKIMEIVGVGDAIRTSQRLGITGLDRGAQYYGLSLVLGGGEVALLDHTYAYSVLGNGGVMAGQPIPAQEQRAGFRTLNPVVMLEVQDTSGNVIKAQVPPQSEQVLAPEVHYIISDILSDDRARAAAFGYDSDLTLPDRPVAAKTGTTNNIRDTWALGYTPQLAVGVWVGNTDNIAMNELSGLSGAAPIWNAVMLKYHENKPVQWYQPPPSVIAETVCAPSGLQVTPQCQRTRQEWFIAGTEPAIPDNIWQAFEIDTATGQLASTDTPATHREVRYYQMLPIEAQDWIVETGLPQPPSQPVTAVSINPDQTIAILHPEPNQYIGAQLEVTGFVQDPGISSWQLDLGPADLHTTPVTLASGRGSTYPDLQIRQSTLDLADGAYSLRLRATHRNGRIQEVKTSIFIDNSFPEVELVAPEPNQIFLMDQDEQVNIHVEASDAGSIAKVEFWVNDELLKTRTVPPYNERWRIEMQNLPATRFAEPLRMDTKTIKDEVSDQILSEIPVIAEETHDWFPEFESEQVALTRGQIRLFHTGFGAIRTTGGLYMERNTIRVRVIDRAGNVTESPVYVIYVIDEEDLP